MPRTRVPVTVSTEAAYGISDSSEKRGNTEKENEANPPPRQAKHGTDSTSLSVPPTRLMASDHCSATFHAPFSSSAAFFLTQNSRLQQNSGSRRTPTPSAATVRHNQSRTLALFPTDG